MQWNPDVVHRYSTTLTQRTCESGDGRNSDLSPQILVTNSGAISGLDCSLFQCEELTFRRPWSGGTVNIFCCYHKFIKTCTSLRYSNWRLSVAKSVIFILSLCLLHRTSVHIWTAPKPSTLCSQIATCREGRQPSVDMFGTRWLQLEVYRKTHAMPAYWSVDVEFTRQYASAPFHFKENTSSTSCSRGWMGPECGLDVLEKREIFCPCQDSNLVALHTVLSRHCSGGEWTLNTRYMSSGEGKILL